MTNKWEALNDTRMYFFDGRHLHVKSRTDSLPGFFICNDTDCIYLDSSSIESLYEALFAIEIRMGYFDIAVEEGKIYPDEVDIDRIVGRIENASKRLEHMLNELKREIFEEEKGEERDGTENCDQR